LKQYRRQPRSPVVQYRFAWYHAMLYHPASPGLPSTLWYDTALPVLCHALLSPSNLMCSVVAVVQYPPCSELHVCHDVLSRPPSLLNRMWYTTALLGVMLRCIIPLHQVSLTASGTLPPGLPSSQWYSTPLPSIMPCCTIPPHLVCTIAIGIFPLCLILCHGLLSQPPWSA
jgi:hypothetical protein